MDDLIPVNGDPAATTRCIQAAIDRAHADGGGRVVLRGGQRFVCGSLLLKSGVELHLSAGCVLAASPRREDYREVAFGGVYGSAVSGVSGTLISAEDAVNISITGTGTIDGQALHWMSGFRDADGKYIREHQSFRPRGIVLDHCQGVRLESFTLRDMPFWTVHLTGCSDVLCQGLSIFNRLDVPNCDGIDPDRCRNVRIIGCHIEAGDDCIVLKNTKPSQGRWADAVDCSDITAIGNTLVSTSAALKIGTESHGDFRRIVFSGNVIRGSHRGIALQLRDGGTIEDVLISDTVVETRRFCSKWWGNGEVLAITCVPRSDDVVPGRIRRIRVRSLLARGDNGIVLHGCAASPLQDIALAAVDCRIASRSRWPGGRLDLRPMLGGEHVGNQERSEAGLLARQIHGLRLDDVCVQRDDQQPWYGACRDIAEVTELSERDCRWV